MHTASSASCGGAGERQREAGQVELEKLEQWQRQDAASEAPSGNLALLLQSNLAVSGGSPRPHLHMQALLVCGGVDGHGLQAQLAAGADDTHRDLAAAEQEAAGAKSCVQRDLGHAAFGLAESG